MKLSCDRDKLALLKDPELSSAIIERRDVILNHSAQRGDDRCWLDDYLVWGFLDDTQYLVLHPTFNDGMAWCREFHTNRRMDIPSILYGNGIDLEGADREQLIDELYKIQRVIKDHRSAQPITCLDDLKLYEILPGEVEVDFRLPPEEEFLGEAKAPHAGCPSFWRSHEKCPWAHNLHQWGPCTNP